MAIELSGERGSNGTLGGSVDVPVSVSIDGGLATHHLLQAYDGYTSLAGLSWSLSLLAHYTETGRIRRRGEFDGRSSVFARPLTEGSVAVELMVMIQSQPTAILGTIAATATTAFFYDIVKRTIDRNLGIESEPSTSRLRQLLQTRGGEIEALIAANEPALKQGHSVIGAGANVINIYGGTESLATLDPGTKSYMSEDYIDNEVVSKDVSVASFNANSGHGSVLDFELGRVIPFKMRQETLRRVKSVFSWGLYEYSRNTNRTISATFTKVVALDGRVKKYIILDAGRISDRSQTR